MEKKQLTLTLRSAGYSGDNLGDDIQFRITVEDKVLTITRKIKHNTTISIKKIVSKKEVNSNVAIPIHVQITEKDPSYNDIGSNSSNFQVLYDGLKIQTHSFQVTVSGDSIGDRKKTAVFTLKFEAELQGIGIRYVKNVSKRGWLTIKHEDELTGPKVLPYALQVQVTELKNGREFFIIQEGPLKGHKGSIRLTNEAASFLTEENLHTDSVYLIFSKEKETLQIAGTNKTYWAVLDSANPVTNGAYDLEIPYEPHHRYGEYYEKYSIYAKTWFRIGHSGDRYLHFGRYSAGCITVRRQENNPAGWNEIYQLLITGRKGDSKSVGIIEVVD